MPFPFSLQCNVTVMLLLWLCQLRSKAVVYSYSCACPSRQARLHLQCTNKARGEFTGTSEGEFWRLSGQTRTAASQSKRAASPAREGAHRTASRALGACTSNAVMRQQQLR
jgi:hypothetical protein